MRKSTELKVGGIRTKVLLDEGTTPKNLYYEIMSHVVEDPHHPQFREEE